MVNARPGGGLSLLDVCAFRRLRHRKMRLRTARKEESIDTESHGDFLLVLPFLYGVSLDVNTWSRLGFCRFDYGQLFVA